MHDAQAFKGGQRLRTVYIENSAGFSFHDVSSFGQMVAFGVHDAVEAALKSGKHPPLDTKETCWG